MELEWWPQTFCLIRLWQPLYLLSFGVNENFIKNHKKKNRYGIFFKKKILKKKNHPLYSLYKITTLSTSSQRFALCLLSSLCVSILKYTIVMGIPLILLVLLALLAPTCISSSIIQDPELVVQEVHK